MATATEIVTAAIADETEKQQTLDTQAAEIATLQTQIVDPAKLAELAALPGVAAKLNPAPVIPPVV